MKRLLLFAAFLCSANLLNAQSSIVLTSDNVAMIKPGDAYSWHSLFFDIMEIPKTGDNQIWNYSSVQLETFSYTQTYPSANNPAFPEATYTQPGVFGFSYFDINGLAYFQGKTTGEYYIGNSYDEISHELGGTATLYIPAQTHVYGEGYTSLQLPARYNSSWQADIHAPLNAEITFAPLGFFGAPFLHDQISIHRDTVVGAGTLILPGNIVLEALLVKSERTTIDSFYVNGKPAPDDLLQFLLGIEQGWRHITTYYNFYTAGVAGPVMTFIAFDGSTYAASVGIRDDLFTTSVGTETTVRSVQLYPNPVSGREATIAFDKSTNGTWNIIVRNMMGQTVQTLSVQQPAGAATIRLALDPSLANGTYFYELRNEKSERTGSGSFIVTAH